MVWISVPRDTPSLMDDSRDPVEDMLSELRRRALRVVGEVPLVEDEATLVTESDVARVNELIEKHGWHHLRRNQD